MALFDRFTKKGHVPQGAQKSAPPKEKLSVDEKADASKELKPIVLSDNPRAVRYAGLLLKPHVSEKAAFLAERGIYVFDVPVSANKVEVRKAVEATYNVNVKAVRTQRGIGKVVTRGRIKGRRNAWKKALVELVTGQKISLVEGV